MTKHEAQTRHATRGTRPVCGEGERERKRYTHRNNGLSRHIHTHKHKHTVLHLATLNLQTMPAPTAPPTQSQLANAAAAKGEDAHIIDTTEKGNNDKNVKIDKSEKQSRRRSMSAFTFHSNKSFDQPKRRSFSSKQNNNATSNRRSFSHSATPSITTSNSLSDGRKNTRSVSGSGMFFSSPHFASSTPNLAHKTSKYIDSELRASHSKVNVGGKNIVSLTVPTILHKCCDFIINTPPIEGLFRMNGSIKQVNQIEMDLAANIDSYSFKNDHPAAILDIAVVLKRWIAKLDDGVITADVCHLLTQIQKESKNIEYPSEVDDDDDDDIESIIDMENTVSISPVKQQHQCQSQLNDITSAPESEPDEPVKPVEVTVSSSTPITSRRPSTMPAYKSYYSSALRTLPIENLHLLLYLLDVLYKLSDPQISTITKMHTSNLAKVFQLNIFRSVDLITSLKSFSTEDLKSSYNSNEELLTHLIEQTPLILDDLSEFITQQQPQMERILNFAPSSSDSIEHSAIDIPSQAHSSDSSLGSSIFVKKRHTASPHDFYSSRNSSMEHIPHSGSRAKELDRVLEPCVEKPSAPVTPIAGVQRMSFETLRREDAVSDDVVAAVGRFSHLAQDDNNDHNNDHNYDIHHHHVNTKGKENLHHSKLYEHRADDNHHSQDLQELQVKKGKRKSFFGMISSMRKSSMPVTEVNHPVQQETRKSMEAEMIISEPKKEIVSETKQVAGESTNKSQELRSSPTPSDKIREQLSLLEPSNVDVGVESFATNTLSPSAIPPEPKSVALQMPLQSVDNSHAAKASSGESNMSSSDMVKDKNRDKEKPKEKEKEKEKDNKEKRRFSLFKFRK